MNYSLPLKDENEQLFLFQYNENGFDCNQVFAKEQKDFIVDFCKKHPKKHCYGSENGDSVKCEDLVDCFSPITRAEAETLKKYGMNKSSIMWCCVFEDYEEIDDKWHELCSEYRIKGAF